MHISQIVIVKGFTDEKPGNLIKRHSEYDIVKGYALPLVDEVDENKLHFEIRGPNDPFYDGSLVIHCGGGWVNGNKQAATNASTITYSSNAKQFAQILRDTVCEWGQQCVNEKHRLSAFTEDDELTKGRNAMVVEISPFKLNGPQADEYMRFLPRLGMDIAKSIYTFLIERKEGPKMGRVHYA